MFGNRQKTATATPAPPLAPPRVRPLQNPNELLRYAAWERLSDPDRASLRQGFPAFPTSVTPDALAGVSDPALRDLQDWIAAVIADRFQPEATQLIRLWLDSAAPDAHLFVGGEIGQGRRSLVASLARSAMSKLPASPDYCYIPVPSAMDHAYLLTLPHGLGLNFAKTIDRTLRAVTSGWSGDNNAPTPDAAARASLIAQAFAPLEQPTFAAVQSYVKQLRAAFEAFATSQSDIPVS